jgi:hypothetical protein
MHRRGALFALLLAVLPALAAGSQSAMVETTAGPYRIEVERVSVFETRSLEGGGHSRSVQRSCALTLRLTAAAPEELQAILGIAPEIRAMDDTGQRLHARGPVLPSFSAGAVPGGSRLVASLEAPDRRATRLAEVAGELILYRTVTPARIEFDLAADPGERVETLGSARITLQKAEVSGDECVVRLRVEGDPALVVADQPQALERAVPVLLTRSGARHRLGSFSATSGVSPEGKLFTEQKLTFRGLKEAPSRLVLDALLKSDPDRRIAFRLVDVPLPPEYPAQPASGSTNRRIGVAPSRSDVTGVRVTGPLAAVNGGSLAGAVEATGAGGGRVAFGLSLREGSGWSAVRWIEAPTDAAGMARITGMRPGRYRVRRTFTRTTAGTSAAGGWKNDDVTVFVVAGMETLLPPLQREGK